MDCPMRLISLLIGCVITLGAGFAATAQQSPFSPRVLVNDSAVTHYEVEQRVLFLKLLNTPGDLEKEAIKALIEDRLRQQAAKLAEIALTPEQITAGIEEFAGRAQLSSEEFLQAIAQGGVAQQSFQDFVVNGLLWREVVRAKFGPKIAVTEADIDRALALSSQRGAVRVLLSEIILPATPEFAAQSKATAERLASTLRGEAAFGAAAREVSVSGSRDQGGRLDWMPLANLPPQIAALILPLAPGEVSQPIPVSNAIALFLLRGIEDAPGLAADAVSVDYAQFLIPGGRSTGALAEAERVRARVDTCADLYGVGKGLPEARLQRDVLPMSQVPGDIGLELARLDEGESSTALVRGDALVFLMLCERRPVSLEPPSRDSIRQQITNQQLAGYAELYLSELKANAYIVTP